MNLSQRFALWATHYDRRDSLGTRCRSRRMALLVDIMREVFQERGRVDVVDLGGTAQYWKFIDATLLESLDVRITLINLPGVAQPGQHGRFTFVNGDACQLAHIPDGTWDIVHSNSVLEHVGDWSRMRAFAGEVARIGRCSFVQTPNFWFPIEPHCLTPFFHWLPEPCRMRLVQAAPLGHWPKAPTPSQAMELVQSARLLSEPMLRSLFPDARIVRERVFGCVKSLIAIRRGS